MADGWKCPSCGDVFAHVNSRQGETFEVDCRCGWTGTVTIKFSVIAPAPADDSLERILAVAAAQAALRAYFDDQHGFSDRSMRSDPRRLRVVRAVEAELARRCLDCGRVRRPCHCSNDE